MPGPPTRSESPLVRLAPVVVIGAVIAGFALLHLDPEVPREWRGWAVLGVLAPPFALAISSLVAALLRRRAARRLRAPASAPGSAVAAVPAVDERRAGSGTGARREVSRLA